MIAHFHASSRSFGILRRDPRNLFFLDSKWYLEGIWHPFGYFEETERGLGPVETETVLSLLQSCTPIWSRHGPGSGQLDNYLTRLTFWINLLVKDLRGLGVENAVFHTSVPHHASTICFQIACQIAEIPAVYLFMEIVSGRTMPVTINLFDSPLVPLGAKVSSHDPDQNIMSLRDSVVSGEKLWFETKLLPNVSRSLLLSAGALVVWRAISGLKVGFRRASAHNRRRQGALHHFESEVDLDYLGRWAWSLSEELRTMKIQSEAIAVLRRDSKNLASLQSRKRVLVFYAHYQPEASTFPQQGVVLSSMLRAVEAIRVSGWDGPIVFREHPGCLRYLAKTLGPTRVGVARNANFYHQLKRMDVHVQFPGKVSESFPDAIVATLAGSIAVERALQGRPTLVVGRPWYGRIPGSVEITSDLSWLRTYDQALRAGGVSAGAAAHLRALLHGRTIKNLQGIGHIWERGESSRNSTASAEREYDEEMSFLADWLISNRGFDRA